MAGAGRFDDSSAAVARITKLKTSDVEFAYNPACLESIKGRTDDALAMLERAIKNGWTDIPHAKSDPDLAAVRAEKVDMFKDLTDVKFKWSIDWGIHSDDIVLTNQSAFAMTNIKALLRVASTGYGDWVETLKVDSLAPGGTHRWNTPVSSPGANTRARMTISVDQDH